MRPFWESGKFENRKCGDPNELKEVFIGLAREIVVKTAKGKIGEKNKIRDINTIKVVTIVG